MLLLMRVRGGRSAGAPFLRVGGRKSPEARLRWWRRGLARNEGRVAGKGRDSVRGRNGARDVRHFHDRVYASGAGVEVGRGAPAEQSLGQGQRQGRR